MNPAFSEAVRDFQNFLRAQKGAYTDACAGFRRNEITIKRQVSRILKRGGTKSGDGGIPSVIMTVVENPDDPDSIVQTIRLSREYLEANARAGSNEQQMSRAIIVFVYTYWDDVTRYECAAALAVDKSEIKLPIAGDLRLLRHAILHDHGILSTASHRKLGVLGDRFTAGQEITFSHATMHEIFRLIDKHIAQFTLQKLDIPPPPGGWDQLKVVAIPQTKAGPDD